ncbi:rhodanese-like domain-containing protein [Chitinibacteraceae bacterium HSL-7]
MSTTSDILQRARERAQGKQLPYSGAVTPAEAHELMKGLAHAVLVDVRSKAEWTWVGGVPDSVQIEWRAWDRINGMMPNPDFMTQLKSRVDCETVVLFLCRSGARSHEAAALAAQHGYAEAFNVLEGFEGDKNGEQHRGAVNGWQAAGLPWVQG